MSKLYLCVMCNACICVTCTSMYLFITYMYLCVGVVDVLQCVGSEGRGTATMSSTNKLLDTYGDQL